MVPPLCRDRKVKEGKKGQDYNIISVIAWEDTRSPRNEDVIQVQILTIYFMKKTPKKTDDGDRTDLSGTFIFQACYTGCFSLMAFNRQPYLEEPW